jgi:hypothetical protein
VWKQMGDGGSQPGGKGCVCPNMVMSGILHRLPDAGDRYTSSFQVVEIVWGC